MPGQKHGRGTKGVSKKKKTHTKGRPCKNVRDQAKADLLYKQRRNQTNNPLQAISNKKKQTGSGHVSPYKNTQRLLIIGEGNFSFAASLAENFKGAESITATVFDSEEDIRAKYADAQGHLEVLHQFGAEVLYGIDCTNLAQHADALKHSFGAPFDIAIFNFPHTGSGEKDQAKNVAENQALIAACLRSVQPFLAPGGEVHITTKNGEPYTKWEVAKVGIAVGGLRLKTAIDFRASLYPRYEHRRTLGFDDAVSKDGNADIRKYGAKTYQFQLVTNKPPPMTPAEIAAAAHGKKTGKTGSRGGRDDLSSDSDSE